MNIIATLKHKRLMGDGAFGTYYASLEGAKEQPAEKANLNQPELVKRIHKEYIEAGAEFIRTNTFGIGRKALDITREEQEELITKAYQLAEEAVSESKQSVFIAADIGPLQEEGLTEPEDILREYHNICDVFLKLGADLFLFETFSNLTYIEPLTAYIRKRSDAVILTQFSVSRYGYSKDGISAQRLLDEAGKIAPIDGVGFNCGVGAGHLLQVVKKLQFPDGKIRTAFPNSSYPQLMQDRAVYLDNHQYFAEKLKELAALGIHMVGGCCGTVPDSIRKARQMLDFSPVITAKGEKRKDKTADKATVPTNEFQRKLLEGKKVIAVELDPPFDEKADRIMECASILSRQNIDIITFADSPMGRGRVDSTLMAVKVANETGMPIMPHIACRDKNVIAMRAGILGGYMNGIRNLLLVTGDPIGEGNGKSVFDFNSIKLMKYVQQMNLEHFSEDPICFGGALNQGRANIDSEIRRMEKKIEAGASYFLSQPIFSKRDIERISYIKERVDTKILCGVMPLVSYRNASFIKNEITGIDVPDEVISRFSPELTREQGEKAGVTICAEIMKALEGAADGFYFMLPFNRVHLVELCLVQMNLI